MHTGIFILNQNLVTFRIINGSQSHYVMRKTSSSLDAQIPLSLSACKLSTYLNMKIFSFVGHIMDILQHETVVNRKLLKALTSGYVKEFLTATTSFIFNFIL